MNKKNHRSFGYIRVLPSKRLQASYVGPDKVRYYAPNTFQVQRDANAWLSRVQAQIERGTWANPALAVTALEPSISDGFETFVNSRITRRGKPLAESTIHHYRKLMATTLAEFAPRKFSEISSEDVNKWYTTSVRSGKVTTASKGYKLLKALFGWAISKKFITLNPCQISGAQTAVTGKTVSIPTPEQVRLISNFMPDELRFAVLLAAYAGLRFGEMTELRRSDIRFTKNESGAGLQISVTRAVSYFDGRFVISAPKSNAGTRLIDVTSALTEEAMTHLDSFVGRKGDALLFPDTLTGGNLRHDKFMKRWLIALSKAELEGQNLTPHSLRHFGATALVRAGATLPELKIWLGDSSTEAVTRYLHATGRQGSIANSMEFFK